jgi:aminoglycoside phosphotransferase (APT) family kinase protein
VLHGDYWPGNVLWRDGRLAGVVDWEDALFGDPLADLAVTRLEIGGLYGVAAMNLLTRQYLARRPELDVSALPLWDLRAAMRASGFALGDWGLSPERLTAVQAAYDEFAETALGQVRPVEALVGYAKVGASRRDEFPLGLTEQGGQV